MVEITFEESFKRTLAKFRHATFRTHVKQQIAKIVRNPAIGKPMRNVRKGTREVYVGSFRLSYLWLQDEDRIILLDLYHKDAQ